MGGFNKLSEFRARLSQIGKFASDNLDLIGVMDGEYAFAGPAMVQIDLTNSCNNNCIACWCRSPLLEEDVQPPEIQAQTLPLDLVKTVIEDIVSLGGGRDIALSGGGDPLMHPNFEEILAHLKKLGLTCHLSTNFTRADRRLAEKIVDCGLDYLNVSLWAASPETYAKTHPNKDEKTFDRLLETVAEVIRLKGARPPWIKLHNVIFNMNYHEIEDMVDLAERLGVDAVEFVLVDVIPGRTDKLLLNEEQRQAAMAGCTKVRQRILDREASLGVEIILFDDFLRRLSNEAAVTGDYDQGIHETVPCNIGWSFARILADGNVNYCLKAHKIPVGNIYQAGFKEIWNSENQRKLRRLSRLPAQSAQIFSMMGNDPRSRIGCHRGCDNLDRNRDLWQRLKNLTPKEKMVLRGWGFYQKLLKKPVTS